MTVGNIFFERRRGFILAGALTLGHKAETGIFVSITAGIVILPAHGAHFGLDFPVGHIGTEELKA